MGVPDPGAPTTFSPLILALLRHGIAHDAGPDTEWRDEPRRLTTEGLERMRQAARGIATLELPVETVLSSPLTRCAETAGLVADRLGNEVREHAALRPGMRSDLLIDLLAEYHDTQGLLVCGHQPDLSLVVADLTGAAVDFRRGSLAVIRLDGLRHRAGTLTGLYAPRVLRRLGRATTD